MPRLMRPGSHSGASFTTSSKAATACGHWKPSAWQMPRLLACTACAMSVRPTRHRQLKMPTTAINTRTKKAQSQALLFFECIPLSIMCESSSRDGKAERLLEILAKTASACQTLAGGRDRLFIPIDTDIRGSGRQAAGVNRPAVCRIGFHPQMRQHVMSTATLPFRTQRGDIDGSDDDLLSRTRVGLGQDTAVVINDHAATRPTE